jgi:branched-chain amino acid transport system substrate-binding protein
MVMIAPTSTTTELVQVTDGPDGVNYIFRTIPSDQFTGTALARYMLNQMQKQKATIFYNSASSYSNSLKTAFETTLSLEGGEVVQVVDLNRNNAASTPANPNAQVIALLPDSETLISAIQVAQVNQNRLPLLAGDAVYKIESLQQGGAALNGLIVSVPWHPEASPNPNFPPAAVKLWGGDVNWRTALSYDAVQTIEGAIALGKVTPGSGEPGRVALAKALVDPNFQAQGATGDIRFLPSGDRNNNVLLLKVQPGSRSGTGYDFVPLQ